MAVDAAGNVYVTGESAGIRPGPFDYATAKYDAYGRELWVARFTTPGDSFDSAVAVGVDAAGHVFVTGRTGGDDYGTIKYDADGTELWVAFYNGPGNSTDIARALAVDAAGHVHVTGDSVGVDTDFDYATVKYVQTNPPDEQFMLTLTKEGTGRGTVTSSPSGVACGHDFDQPSATAATFKLTPRAAFGF